MHRVESRVEARRREPEREAKEWDKHIYIYVKAKTTRDGEARYAGNGREREGRNERDGEGIGKFTGDFGGVSGRV